MKKYFFLSAITIMATALLTACLGNQEAALDNQPPPDQAREAVPDAMPSVGGETREPSREESSRALIEEAVRPHQACNFNLTSVVWTCEKEGEKAISYFVNQRPSQVDADPDTGERKPRVCELRELSVEPGANSDPSQGEVIRYAHWTHSECVNALNEEVGAKREKGFQCEKGQEILDETKASGPCSS